MTEDLKDKWSKLPPETQRYLGEELGNILQEEIERETRKALEESNNEPST
jgi:TRAP-type C4-dicarboxylate transport system substrate-binding protein